MLWGERVGRRRVLLVLAAAFVALDALLALALFSGQDAGAQSPAALPLHPVAGSFVPDDTRLTDCSDEQCFQQAFGNISYVEGSSAALARLATVYGSGWSESCHRATHAIGAASLVRNRGDVAATFAEGDSRCGSGFYHGVLERSLVRVSSRRPDHLAPVARSLCSSASHATPWVEYQCFHGLGHGLMISTGLSLPISLEVCGRLTRWWDGDACRSGAFMENLSTSSGAQSLFLKDDDPLYPCNWVERAAKRRCYRIVAYRILGAVGWNFERAARVCTTVEAGFVADCFRSLGKDASNHSRREPAPTVEKCALAREVGGEADCLFGAAQDVVANFGDGRRARPLCDLVTGELAVSCFEGLGSVMGRFRRTVEARIADCRTVSSSRELLEACMRGGRSALPHA